MQVPIGQWHQWSCLALFSATLQILNSHCQPLRPWMTLNGHYALVALFQNTYAFISPADKGVCILKIQPTMKI